MYTRHRVSSKGFTLIELLVVIGIIGILAAVVLVAVNPGRQFGLARDAQRRSDLYSITLAVYQYAVDNGGTIPAAIPDEGATITEICANLADINGGQCINLEFLKGKYMPSIPVDPGFDDTAFTPKRYKIYKNTQNRVVAEAQGETDADGPILPTPIRVTR